jgi:hypothetical protein
MTPAQYKRALALKPGGGGSVNYVAPTSPPPGSYDPSLDAAYDSASRGYRYGVGDAATGDLRGTEDYQLAHDQITRQRDQTLSDLLTSHTREGQDYSSATQNLQRSFQRLGDSQAQNAQAAGVAGGGALAQALQKRTENQSIEQAPIDTSHQRALENYNTGVTRTNEGADLQLGHLDLLGSPASAENPAGGREWQDRHTTLARQGEELSNFGLDTNASRWYQATANGYAPPDIPQLPSQPTVASYVTPKPAPIRMVNTIRPKPITTRRPGWGHLR